MENNLHDGRVGAFPAAINQHNPTPNPAAVTITALVKKSGRVTGYQLSDGRRVTRDQGVRMARQNEIGGVAVAVNQGTEYLRTLPDGADNNNLGSLPSVTE